MSALHPKADMCSALAHVCFGPIADIRRAKGMGLNDLYPFLLSPSIIVKLTYVCNLIQHHSMSDRFNDEDALKAIMAGLKKGLTAPI